MKHPVIKSIHRSGTCAGQMLYDPHGPVQRDDYVPQVPQWKDGRIVVQRKCIDCDSTTGYRFRSGRCDGCEKRHDDAETHRKRMMGLLRPRHRVW